MPGARVEKALEISAGSASVAISRPSSPRTNAWKTGFFEARGVKTQRSVSAAPVPRKTTAELTKAPSERGAAEASRTCRTAAAIGWCGRRGRAAPGVSPAAGGATRSGLTMLARATVSLTSLKRPGSWIASMCRDGSTTILIWRLVLWVTSRIRGQAVLEPRRTAEHDEDLTPRRPRPGRLFDLEPRVRRLDPGEDHLPELVLAGAGRRVTLEPVALDELLARVARIDRLPLRAFFLRQEIRFRRARPVLVVRQRGKHRRRQEKQDEGNDRQSPSRPRRPPSEKAGDGRDHPFFGGAFGFTAGLGTAFSGIVPSGFRTTKSSLRSIPLNAAESFAAPRSRTVSVKV